MELAWVRFTLQTPRLEGMSAKVTAPPPLDADDDFKLK
jgi:hypothetical protein